MPSSSTMRRDEAIMRRAASLRPRSASRTAWQQSATASTAGAPWVMRSTRTTSRQRPLARVTGLGPQSAASGGTHHSDPRRPSGVDPVTPERVHFEALSADVWGWVVKTISNESGVGEHFTTTSNVVLAPRNEQIAVLTEFNAAFQVLGAGNCKETESQYADWEKAKGEKKTAPAEGEGAQEASGEEGEEEFELVPPRCTQLQWSYRTDPVTDATFTPLYITRKAGMEGGSQVEAKTWKVMFDPKSYTYLMPEELKNVGS